MKKSKLIVALLGALSAMPVLAADAPKPDFSFSSNVGMVSDYIYRGITQTSHSAAVQGGFDVSHASGVYAGVWGSNQSWVKDSGATATGNTSLELDTYLGYKGEAMADVGYDVGLVRYNYLGTYTPADGFNRADTQEAYVGVSYKFLSLKYSYSMLDGFLTVGGTKGTNYIDLSANYPLEDMGVTLTAHVGKQTFVGTTKDADGNDLGYTDYKLGASKDIGGYVFGVNYTTTNVTPAWQYSGVPAEGQYWGKSVIAVSLTHAM